MTIAELRKNIKGNYQYKGYEIHRLLDDLDTQDRSELNVKAPSRLKKGDMVLVLNGAKQRPAVIVKVLKEEVILMTLTTQKDIYSLSPAKSRFLDRDSYFCKGFSTISIDLAKRIFIGPFDNPRLLNEAIRLNKEYLSQL